MHCGTKLTHLKFYHICSGSALWNSDDDDIEEFDVVAFVSAGVFESDWRDLQSENLSVFVKHEIGQWHHGFGTSCKHVRSKRQEKKEEVGRGKWRIRFYIGTRRKEWNLSKRGKKWEWDERAIGDERKGGLDVIYRGKDGKKEEWRK